MDYEGFTMEKSEGIATITLDRPDKLNALNIRETLQIYELLDDFEKDKAVRAVVFTGAGRAFSVGHDVDELADTTSRTIVDKEVDERSAILFTQRIYNLEKPTIAAINGIAVGAGLAMTLAFDIRIASDNAKFGFVFPKRGLASADFGCTWFLPRLVGAGWASELLLTGDIIDAQLAERIKLVNRVVPAEELPAATKQLAEKLASGPPLGLKMTKRALALATTSDLLSVLNYEVAAETICLETKDHQEGIKSFMEKRPAKFTGE